MGDNIYRPALWIKLYSRDTYEMTGPIFMVKQYLSNCHDQNLFAT